MIASNINFQKLKMSRGMSAGGGDGSGGEILRLRKELVHAKTQITDLQEELQEKTTLYIQAINVSISAPILMITARRTGINTERN